MTKTAKRRSSSRKSLGLNKCRISGVIPTLDARMEPRYSPISDHYLGDYEIYDLHCNGCERYGRGCASGCYDFDSKQEIIETWNARNPKSKRG